MKRTATALAFISVPLVLLLLVAFVPSLKAVDEAPQMEWSKTFYGIGGHAIQTADGGYAIASRNASLLHYPAWERAPMLIKTDSSGAVQWNKTFDAVGLAGLNSIVQTKDLGYALSGSNIAPPNMSPVYSGWLIKTDDKGNVQWNKTFGSLESCHVIQTSDGGYVLVGTTGHDVSSIAAVFLKTDGNGNVLWDKTETINGNWPSVFARDVVETDGGGYAVAGSWEGDSWLMMTDSNGNLQWNQTYPTIYSDKHFGFNSVAKTSDGGYILAGLKSGGFAWLVKTDSQGNEQWDRNYPSGLMGFTSVAQTIDGGCVAVGTLDRQALLVRTDASGSFRYFKLYGNEGENVSSSASSVVSTADGGYAIAGTLDTYAPTSPEVFNVTPSMGNNAWLIKFAPESNVPPDNVSPPFPTTWIVAAVTIVTVISVALLVYFKKRKREGEPS